MEAPVTVSTNHRPQWMSPSRLRALRCPDCGCAPVTFAVRYTDGEPLVVAWTCAGMERHRNEAAWSEVEMGATT